MNRRDFLQRMAGAAGLILATDWQSTAMAEVTRTANYKALNIQNIDINIGLEKSFKALHISDSHLTTVDKRDDELKQKLTNIRHIDHTWAEYYLNASIQYAVAHDLQLIHTGDVYDMITEANLDLAGAYYKNHNWLTAVGNHEFNIYLHEAEQTDAYKAKSFDKVQSAYPHPIDFSSQVVNGINFVNLDDSFYKIKEKQFEQMKEEVKKGLPIVLLCHIPFYTPKHGEHNLGRTKARLNLCGGPREVTDSMTARRATTYSDVEPNAEWRKCSIQQRADETTLDFLKWLKEQKQLKAILCGHCHHFWIEEFSPTAIQYCVGANYKGDAYEVTFK